MKLKTLSAAQRLIVAADPGINEGTSPYELEEWVLKFVDSLSETGVSIKVNSVLRACGYSLIRKIQDRGLRVFDDAKLYDIEETLKTDATLLNYSPPEMLTVSCSASLKFAATLKELLPETEIFGVTVLTGMTEAECWSVYNRPLQYAVRALAARAAKAGLHGVICSAKEVSSMKGVIRKSMSINTAAIRPTWYNVERDDQNKFRTATPKEAIQRGAHRIIVGRPITRAENPYDATMRTIDEIASALP
jgi:orotidine-5'-phosphate decarboxylase